jgi:hypothetical protein
MNSTPNGWKIFDGETPVLTYEYTFGAGSAVALAVGTGAGVVVISPPCRVGAGVFDDLGRFGPVVALVAPNGFHHLGLALWHGRFPQASVFAPEHAVQRVQQKTGVQGIRPVNEVAALCGPHLSLTEMPHCKTGEALVRVDGIKGPLWFITDVVTNMPTLPANLLARLVFQLSGSAPGLRFNNLAGLVIVRDKRRLKQWLAEQVAAAPPRWLIPSHGDIVDLRAGPAPLLKIFGTS